MLFIRRWLVWLSRIHRVWGFGIQSPTDYAFVRYVVNEHWPYYAYEELTDKDWLTEKLGRLYFRLANWRQPRVMQEDRYQRYWQAGCRKTRFTADVDTVELARIEVEDIMTWNKLLPKCNDQSVVVVEGIWPRNNGRACRKTSGSSSPLTSTTAVSSCSIDIDINIIIR